MSNRAMKLAALGAVAAVALTGCGSSSKSGAASTPTSAAPATSASPAAATSAAATSAAATSGAASASASVAATSAAVVASASASTGGSGGGFVGVILPDTQSSTRWQDQDLPNLTKAFKAAGIKADIQNAQGSDATFGSIGDAMIAEKVQVLILVALDATSASAIESKAAAAGIKTIDYDRLVLGGSANYYVSYDGVGVGKLQGQGLINCLTAAGKTDPSIIEIDGAPTDNNATLFAQGYNSVLKPLYASGKAKFVAEKAVPKWDNTQAGVIFQQLLTANGGKVDGVLVANDGMAQDVITRLKTAGVTAPVTGQDATVPGLQSIMAGDQCMTIFKDTLKEATAVSHLAIELIKGQTPTETFTTSNDPVGKRSVKSVLLQPEAITQKNIEDVIKGGGTTAAAVCTAAFAADCKKFGVS